MKNRLKGTTLIETVLYVAILTAILFVMVNFVLTTTEATLRTERRADILSNAEFLTQHLDYTFSKVTGIDETKSLFNEDNGVLYINFGSQEHYYSLSNNKLTYDGTDLNGDNILINHFYITPVYNKKNNIVGVRIALEIAAEKDQKVKKGIITLYTIR